MTDVAAQINAVRRHVGNRVLEAGEARTLTISQTYDASVEDLWDACTNAERIPRWFLPVTGDLEVGGRYQLEGNAGGEVVGCDPAAGARRRRGGRRSLPARGQRRGRGARLRPAEELRGHVGVRRRRELDHRHAR